MIEVKNNNIYIGPTKLGYISSGRVYEHGGKELGYFTSDAVYEVGGEKLAHIEGDYVYAKGEQMHLEKAIGHIEGVGLTNAERLAITTFFGE